MFSRMLRVAATAVDAAASTTASRATAMPASSSAGSNYLRASIAGSWQRGVRFMTSGAEEAAEEKAEEEEFVEVPDGTVFVWGSSGQGKLGDPSLDGSSVLTPAMNMLVPGPVRMVACNSRQTLAVTDDGDVWTWGSTDCGSLGVASLEDASVPAVEIDVPVRIETLAGHKIVQASVGDKHAAAVSEEGDVYTWGWGGSFWRGYGGLGHGDKTDQPFPGLVDSLAEDGVRMVQVSCGAKHTLGLSDTGVVYGWGDGEFGRLGNGKSSHPVPEVIELLEGIPCKQVAAGDAFSAAVSVEGELYVWGRNDQSQLGLGANLTMDINSMEEYPVKSPFFKDKRVAALATGRHHCVAVTDDGEAYIWGARQFIEPQLLTVLEGSHAVQAACGDDFSAIVTADGELYTWGKGFNRHALGHGKKSGEKQPTLVSFFKDAGLPVAYAALGAKHAVAVTGIPTGPPVADIKPSE